MYIVPEIAGDLSARTSNAAEFLEALLRIGNVVETQAAYGNVKRGISEGEASRVRDFKADVSARPTAGIRYLSGREINSGDRSRCVALSNDFGNNAAAAADIDPTQADRKS